ncbi:Angiotensin-converting enzyme [Chionoecetes opilio]|uniref:Angiotensin-converting enzyme n=1 Tax=Chionoecetes opilio TaxID=41210 RepID=A0A8J8W9S5_CHIOP|nr:Angiotensin-converting enzyme [Chionoecetes opilio]
MSPQGTNTDQTAATRFLEEYDGEASVMCNRFMEASWDFNTNVTDFNRRKMLAQQMQWAKFHREKWTEATSFAWKNFTNPTVRRMFSFLTVLGKVALPKAKMEEVRGEEREKKSKKEIQYEEEEKEGKIHT